MNIEEGSEVFIPKDLSQDQLPLSFRFYDPLIQIVQTRMSEHRKDFFKLKNSLQKEIYGKIDTKIKLLEKMGLRDSLKPNLKKLTFKYSSVNIKEKNSIKIHESMFTMGV